VVVLADVADSTELKACLPTVRGKYILFNMLQPTSRTADNWEVYGRPQSLEKIKREHDSLSADWNERIIRTGTTANSLPGVLEDAGAAGIVMSYWSNEFGSNKIFGAKTKKVPTVDLSLEDYGVLFRLAESGQKPRIRVRTESKELGQVPIFNRSEER